MREYDIDQIDRAKKYLREDKSPRSTGGAGLGDLTDLSYSRTIALNG
jgi:hypothetical protein